MGEGKLLRPPPSVMPARLKAEVVLAVQLATRHRTVRLVSVLGVIVLVAGWLDRAEAAGTVASSVFLVPGAVAVVAASRVLAPGAAVASAERAANAWWVAPLGRLVGVALITAAAAAATVVTLVDAQAAPMWLLLVVCGQCVALAGIVMIVSPVWGASAGGASGLLFTLLGPLPPSSVAALLPDGSAMERVGVFLWNSLPLAWRGMRAIEAGLARDTMLLAVWIGVAILGAGWAAVPSAFWADRGPQAS